MERTNEERAADTVVGIVVAGGADRGFRSLDVFLTWYVAGTAAALGLIAANLERLQGLVTLSSIKSALPILGAALLLVMVAKFLGSLICTLAGALDATFSGFKAIGEVGMNDVSREAFAAALERAKPLTQRMWERLTGGGEQNLGRKATRLMICSGFCALAAAVLTVCFWVVLLAPASALKPPSGAPQSAATLQ